MKNYSFKKDLFFINAIKCEIHNFSIQDYLEHFSDHHCHAYLSGQAKAANDDDDDVNTDGFDKIEDFYYKPKPACYRCKKCPDVEFKCHGNIKAHVESKHYSPGYKCDTCEKVFKIENVLRSHRRKGCMVAWQKMKIQYDL